MTQKNRERELKYVISTDKSLEEISKELQLLLKVTPEYAVTKDSYWKSRDKKRYSFVRIRHSDISDAGTPELTLKHVDKGNNIDRLEINVEIDDSIKTLSLLSRILGKPSSFFKEYYYFPYGELEIGIFSVVGDKKRRIFIEAEAKSLTAVKKFFTFIKNELKWNIVFEEKNLFQLFIGDKDERKKI